MSLLTHHPTPPPPEVISRANVSSPSLSLPVAFYLKLFGHEISPRERIMDYIIITICGTLSLVGTVWAFLPKSLIGAE